jgi:hypothetical protein
MNTGVERQTPLARRNGVAHNKPNVIMRELMNGHSQQYGDEYGDCHLDAVGVE